MKSIFTLAVALLFISFNGKAQTSKPLFHRFSTTEGLPSSEIYQVLQDREGYLWFATDHGVSRYNGYDFKTFTSANGLFDNTVFKLFLDKKGKVWMQTFSGQLFYYEFNKIIAYQFNNIIMNIVKNNIPNGFYVDSLQHVYFTCRGIGEFKIESNGNVKTIFKYFPHKGYNMIFLDNMDDGTCLVSGNTLNDLKMPCYLFYMNNKAGFDSILIPDNISGQVSSLRLNSKSILLSVSNSLFELSDGSCRKITELPAMINYLYQDDKKQLWVCTYQGLYLVSTSNNSIQLSEYLENDFISCITIDNEGGYWITSVNNGAFYLPDNRIKSYVFYNDSLTEPLCLVSGVNSIYAGFWNGKLAEMNADYFKTIYSASTGSHVTSLFYNAENNRVYIAKDSAGYLENNKFIAFAGSATRSLKGNFILRKNGDLINASINGLYKINNKEISIVSSPNQRINCIVENEVGVILLGCNNGVYQYEEKTNSISLINKIFKGIRVDDIKYLKNNLCMAARGHGLFLMHNNKFLKIDESKGLCSNILQKIAIDKNVVWCASNNGISKITFKDLETLNYEIANISINEGLPNNEINDLTILNDTVWVASKSAISFFNASTVFNNTVTPIIHFTAFRINNKDTVVTNNYELPYHGNNISIEFEAISFKSGGKINYKYRLINENDSLESITTNRKVEFLSLKPGLYTFSIKAMNSSGKWNLKEAQLQFTILQPIWQRLWFQVLMFLIFCLLLFYILRGRINRIRKEERTKTNFNKQIVQLEMKALRAQMNPHFVFNVMNSIQDYILKNDAKSAQKYLTKFARLVRLILDNSMDGEVVLRNEIKAATLYIELEQQRFDDRFVFEVFIDNQLEIDEILIPSMIIQPYLENAIKHGVSLLANGGKVFLNITEKEGNILIKISDNGIGRAASAEYNKINVREHISYGSTITANRIRAYNIAYNTNIITTITDLFKMDGTAGGTTVEVSIPIKYTAA